MKKLTIEHLVNGIQVSAYRIVSNHFRDNATWKEMWADLNEDRDQWVERIWELVKQHEGRVKS